MLRLGLLLLQELNNKILIFLDKVIGEALGPKVVAKVFSPIGVKGFEDGELRWRSSTGPIDASRMWSTKRR